MDDLKTNVRKDIVAKKKRDNKKVGKSFNVLQEQVGEPVRERKKKLKLVVIRPDKLNLTKPPPELVIGTLKLL